MWYEWNSEADFDNWHNHLCAELGFPIIGTNQLTGELDENAQKTINYTISFQVSDKYIAMVEDEYSDGLIATNLRPPMPEHSL